MQPKIGWSRLHALPKTAAFERKDGEGEEKDTEEKKGQG